MLNNNKSEKKGWEKLIHSSIFLLCTIVVATTLSMTVSHGSIAHAASSNPSSSSSSSGKGYSFIKSSQIQLSKNDESRKIFFHPLFGNVSNFSFQNSPISGVIMAFNSAVLFIAGILAAYTMLAGTVNTAHDGELLGQRWSSSWMPIRTALGAASLLPVFQGFCFAQVLVIWLAMQGAGLANYTWHKYTTNIQNSVSFIDTFSQQQMYNAAFNMFVSNVCTVSLYKASGTKTLKKALGKNNIPDYTITNIVSNNTDKIIYGINKNKIHYMKTKSGKMKPVKTSGTPICGEMQLKLISNTGKNKTTSKKGHPNYKGIHVNGLSKNNLRQLSHQLSNTKKQAFNTMQNNILELAGEFVYHDGKGQYKLAKKNFSPVIPLYSIIQKYTNTVKKSINTAFKSQKFLKTFKTNINKDGWLFAGAWYLKIVQMQRAINGVASQVPQQTQPIQTNVSHYSQFINKNLNAAMQDLDKNSSGLNKQTNNVPTGPNTSNKKINPKGKKHSTGFFGHIYHWIQTASRYAKDFEMARQKAKMKAGKNIVGFTSHPLQSLSSAASSFKSSIGNVVQPIYNMLMNKLTGVYNPIIIAETIGQAMITAGWFILGAGAVAGAFSSAAGFSAVALASTMFTVGAGLAIIIPMTPFIIWVSVILSWMILVAQAVVGAPLWALAHMQPDADGLVGRAGQGYMLILGLTIKPTLMIVGLVFAITLIMPFGYFFNSIFRGAFSFVRNGGSLGIIELVAILFLYWSMLMMILKKSFSLIHMVPDQILGWLNAGLPQLGGDAQQMQQTTNQEMQSAMGQTQQMTGQAATAAGRAYLGHKQAGLDRSGVRENAQMASADKEAGDSYAKQSQQSFDQGVAYDKQAQQSYKQGQMGEYRSAMQNAQQSYQKASDYKKAAMNSYNSASKRLDAAKSSASNLMQHGSVKDRMEMSSSGSPMSINQLEKGGTEAQENINSLENNTSGLEDRLNKISKANRQMNSSGSDESE